MAGKEDVVALLGAKEGEGLGRLNGCNEEVEDDDGGGGGF